MSSRFTPRRTLQKTPAVCESRKPPRDISFQHPPKWILPDTLYLSGNFPDPTGARPGQELIVATLYTVGPLTDSWFGKATIWGFPANIAFGMPRADGRMSLFIFLNPFPPPNWGYATIQYAGPWPQFDTGVRLTPPILLTTIDAAGVQITI